MTCLELSTIYHFLPCSSAEKQRPLTVRSQTWDLPTIDILTPEGVADAPDIESDENGGNTMELQRTRPNFIKVMLYCSWNLLLSATRRPVILANILFIGKILLKMVKFRKFANISYFIASHQTSFFCHQSDAIIARHITKPGKPGVFHALHAWQPMLIFM